MKKRIFALLLSLAMVLSIVSCGNNGTSSSGGSSEVPSSSDAGSLEESDVVTEITLPIVDERMDVTCWTVFSNDYVTIDEVKAYQKLAELTNVHVEYSAVPGTAAQEKFGLLLASGTYPDLVDANMGSQYVKYPGGDDKGIDDGVWRDLTDLIPKNMPNYSSYLNASDDVRRQATTDTGRLAAVYMLRCSFDSIENETVTIEPEPSWMGMAIRQDWLDELNLQVPETIDELYDVLVAFKNAGYGGLGMNANGMVSTNAPYVIGAWEITNEFYVESDGKTVGYGPATDQYKEYLLTMHKWYKEGLIYQDFMSGEIKNNAAALWANGTIGIYTAAWVSINEYYYINGYVDDENFFLTPMTSPVLNKGDYSKVSYQSDTAVSPMYITTSCAEEKVPYLLQWADYTYTWEGAELVNCGVKGESYEIDPESEYYYVFTDAVMKCEIGGAKLAPITSRRLYTLDNYHGLYNWEIMWNLYRQAGMGDYIHGYEVWSQETNEAQIPLRVNFTSEEGDEYNTLYVDIQTYVEECTVKFIDGDLDIEAEWDNYIATLERMNLARCLELKQTAYTRYMNK